MPMLTIAIPTFNRANKLQNSLKIISRTCADVVGSQSVDFCIIDNASTDDTFEVVNQFQSLLHIRYLRNDHNVGLCNNIVNCITKAKGDFTWIIGDDDVILPDSIHTILDSIAMNPDVDFIGLPLGLLAESDIHNALSAENCGEALLASVVPENPALLEFLSKLEGKTNRVIWDDLINPDFNSVFLGALMVSVFRTATAVGAAKKVNIQEGRLQFDDLSNSYPHSMIFAMKFVGKAALVLPSISVAAIRWEREWNPYLPLLVTRRLHDLLDLYEASGVSRISVDRCRRMLFKYYHGPFWRIVLERDAKYRQDFSLRSQIAHYWMYPSFWKGICPQLYLRKIWRTCIRTTKGKLKKIFS